MRSPLIHPRGFWTSHREGHSFDSWLAAALATLFAERSVCDFGCGEGKYVNALRSRKVLCDGVDGNPNTREMTSGVCEVADLSAPLTLAKTYDFAMSLEVAEHIPRPFEDIFLSNLARHARRGIVLSWALPGQVGDGHINNRPQTYVIRKLRKLGFRLDRKRTRYLRSASSLPWFKRTILVFSKHGVSEAFAAGDVKHKPFAQLFSALSLIAFQFRALSTRHQILRLLGGTDAQWTRIVMNRETERFVGALDYEAMEAAEISGSKWAGFGFRSYEMLNYPEFDITADSLPPRRYDLIVIEQVLEHVRKPAKAVRNLHALLKPGGRLVVTTPFLLRVHLEPEDHNRWTETGLQSLLEDAGFAPERISTGSWGNKSCVRTNLYGWWPYIPWLHSLRNEKNFPTVIWAFAQKND